MAAFPFPAHSGGWRKIGGAQAAAAQHALPARRRGSADGAHSTRSLPPNPPILQTPAEFSKIPA